MYLDTLKKISDLRETTQRVRSGAGKAVLFAGAAASLALVGILDYLTGYEISFAVFYLIPVGIVAWRAGPRLAVAIAVLSSIVWYAAEIAAGYPYSHPLIPVWNACVRLTFFVTVSLLLAKHHDRLQIESQLARTDTLTGLLNRRAFSEQLAHELAVSARSGQPLVLVYIDLDGFKSVNDRQGHSVGDRLLQSVGASILSTQRSADTSGRLGGDEFALILPATDEAGARRQLVRLEDAIADEGAAGRLGVTCSIGAVVIQGGRWTAEAAVAAADRNMYAAKQAGKAGVVISTLSEH